MIANAVRRVLTSEIGAFALVVDAKDGPTREFRACKLVRSVPLDGRGRKPL